MASVVALRSNTGSTIAIILAVLGVGAVGVYLASRALKDFKFPDIKFPEFKFPSLIPKIPLEDVANLSLIPQGAGIDVGQMKQAFKISFPTGTVSRSVLPRPILPAGAVGVIGKRLPPRAKALTQPTFVIVREGAKGAPIIGGTQALVNRITANLRRATARKSKPVARKLGARARPLQTSLNTRRGQKTFQFNRRRQEINKVRRRRFG